MMMTIGTTTARLITPSPEWIPAYVEAQRLSDGAAQILSQALEATLAQDAIARGTMQGGGFQRFWIAADSAIVGRVVLRPNIDISETSADHVAYHVFPAFRGQGFGHRALALGIEELRRQGMRDLLLICEDDNHASIRIVEAAGAHLEAIVPHPHFPERLVRRYWIREKLA
jgi:predicted acetyltransferase